MLEALELVLSVAAVVALGAALGRTRLFSPAMAEGLSAFVWYIAIPALIFRTMALNPLPGVAELRLVGVYYSGVLIVYALVALIARFAFAARLGEQAVLALTAVFANGLMIGLPIVSHAYGDEGVRVLTILIAFHSSILVTISTILVAIDRHQGGMIGSGIATFASLLRQPVLVALTAGVGFAATGWALVLPVDRLTEILAAAVAPCGLFAIGLNLSRIKIAGDLPQAGVAALAKLVILPLTVFTLMRLAHMPPIWTATATTMAAMPTGVVAYHFAAANGIAARRAATGFLAANLFSVIGLTLWVGWLLDWL